MDRLIIETIKRIIEKKYEIEIEEVKKWLSF